MNLFKDFYEQELPLKMKTFPELKECCRKQNNEIFQNVLFA